MFAVCKVINAGYLYLTNFRSSEGSCYLLSLGILNNGISYVTFNLTNEVKSKIYEAHRIIFIGRFTFIKDILL